MQLQLRLDRREALLMAAFPFVALSLLNHFYKAPLYAIAPAWLWAADAAQFVLMPVACWLLVLRPAAITLADLGMQVRLPVLPLSAVVWLGLLLLAWTWPVHLLAWGQGWQYADAHVVYEAIPKEMFTSHLLVAIYMSVTAAVVEEVAYRALPWLYFREAMGPRWRRTAYVVLTSVVFAACHSEQGPAGVIASFWFGVVAARIYTKWGSLWPVILGHFIFDMIVFGPW